MKKKVKRIKSEPGAERYTQICRILVNKVNRAELANVLGLVLYYYEKGCMKPHVSLDTAMDLLKEKEDIEKCLKQI